MKIKLLIPGLIAASILASCSAPKAIGLNEEEKEASWNLEKSRELASDFNSPEKWDVETLEMEVSYVEALQSMDLPLMFSPFPTPHYESPGNGNSRLDFELKGKKIVGHTVSLAKGEHSEYLFTSTNEEMINYFTILALSDSGEGENPVAAISRNHPNYVAQGSLNTETNSRVDWVAIQLADGNAYAIVNSRLFDLRVGRVIFAAPQKDGSLRFYQTENPAMDEGQLQNYLAELANDKKATDFFTKEANI